MFGHPSFNNSTQGRSADLLATSRRVATADIQPDTRQNRPSPEPQNVREGRRIIDQIDESLRINLRLDETLGDGALPNPVSPTAIEN